MNTQRRAIIRRQLWLADPTCRYYKREILWKFSTLDHVNPRSRGGTDQRSNAVLSCHRCNRRKAAMTADELLEWSLRIVAVANRITHHAVWYVSFPYLF